MPSKHHRHEVLVLKRTVWLSVAVDGPQDHQRWRVYRRSGRKGVWWSGLAPKGFMDLENGDLPEPILKKAYAYTEWTDDIPELPNGTALWVEYFPPKMFEIWYSPLIWDHVVETGSSEWAHVGFGSWGARLADWVRRRG